MTNSGNNILNLLMGNLNSKTAKITLPVSGVTAKSSDFMDILNLMGVSPAADGQTLSLSNKTVTTNEFDLLFDENIELASEQITAGANVIATGENDIINNKTLFNGITESLALLNGQATDEVINGWPDNTVLDVPLQAVNVNRFLNDIINNKTLELATGKYLVLESAINDGELNLTLQPQDNPSDKIKITLPVQAMAENNATVITDKAVSPVLALRQYERSNIEAGRESVDTPKLEELFAGLNLKELEIKNISVEKSLSSSPEKMTELKIVAEQAGQELVIRRNIAQSDIKVRDANKNNVINNVESRTIKGDECFRLVDETVATDQKSTMSNRGLFTKSQTNFDEMIFAEESVSLDEIKPCQQKLEPGGTVLEQQVSSDQLTTDKTDLPQVRFSLPDNLKQLLKPNGKSVTIKIEPENLGPARLHLSMNQNGLSARFTVDNVYAKAAVEGSLDQLTEQLSKSGIKVDYIQVGVSNEESQNRNYAWQTPWEKASRFNRLNTSDDLTIDKVTTSVTIVPQPLTYVRADGVNLLA